MGYKKLLDTWKKRDFTIMTDSAWDGIVFPNEQPLNGYDVLEFILIDLAGEQGYEWVASLARYRDRKSKKIVSEKTIINLMDSYGEEVTSNNIASLTDRLLDGSMTLDKWQINMAKELKNSHSVSAMIGKGGRAQMTQADWGTVGGRLRQEYRFLDRFAVEISSGTLTDAQIKFRASLYTQGSRSTFFDTFTNAHIEAGFTEERRVLDPNAESCEDCLGYASQGWQRIGTLPAPGLDSQCIHNCKCHKEYR